MKLLLNVASKLFKNIQAIFGYKRTKLEKFGSGSPKRTVKLERM